MIFDKAKQRFRLVPVVDHVRFEKRTTDQLNPVVQTQQEREEEEQALKKKAKKQAPKRGSFADNLRGIAKGIRESKEYAHATNQWNTERKVGQKRQREKASDEEDKDDDDKDEYSKQAYSDNEDVVDGEEKDKTETPVVSIPSDPDQSESSDDSQLSDRAKALQRAAKNKKSQPVYKLSDQSRIGGKTWAQLK